MPYLRQYGEATTITFGLYSYTDGKDLFTTAAHAAGDTVITKDEGTQASTTNGFVDEGSGYSIALTATEMQARRVHLLIADQGSPAFLAHDIVIETYGHPDAQDPRGVVLRDTAAAVTGSSITFATSAQATADAYNDMVVKIVSNGTASANNQARYIRDYSAARVATLNLDWTVTPTGTVVYEVYASPAGVSDVNVTSFNSDTSAVADLVTNIPNLDAAISTRSSHTAANVRTEIDANSTVLASILDDTGTAGVALSSTATQAVVDELMAESLNGSLTAGTVKAALLVAFAQFVQDASGLTLTYQKPDGSTAVSRTNVRADLNSVRSST